MLRLISSVYVFSPFWMHVFDAAERRMKLVFLALHEIRKMCTTMRKRGLVPLPTEPAVEMFLAFGRYLHLPVWDCHPGKRKENESASDCLSLWQSRAGV